MTPRRDLARTAVGAALRVRRSAGIGLAFPVCPFDLAEQMSVEVRFTDISNLEAMYVSTEQPLILVAGDRPPGRQAFGCAHELGHQVFGHGTRVDLVIGGHGQPAQRSQQEFVADLFAGFLLMSKTAVIRGFAARGWRPESCTPEQAYTLAGWLGVSFEALVTHLTWSLGLLSRDQSARLSRIRLPEIRASLHASDPSAPLVVIDRQWTGRAVDVRVGDHILAPPGTVNPDGLVELLEHRPTEVVLRAVRPGIGRMILADGTWSAYVRVARKGYVGRAIYRHLEDPDCD